MSSFAVLHFWWVFDLEFWSIMVLIVFMGILIKVLKNPIVSGMKSREAGIVNALHQAEIAAEEIRKIREAFEQKRREAKQKADETIAEAGRDAVRVKAELIERANAEGQRQKMRVDREVSLYRNKALSEIWQNAADLSASLTEKMLRADLKADDHRRLIDDAISEIGSLAEVKS